MPDKRAMLVFVDLFAGIFAVYSIPSPGLGRLFVAVATSMANAFVAEPKREGGLGLELRATHEDERDAAWTAVLEARDPASGRDSRVHINLRKCVYLPMAVFTALALASPIWKGRRGVVVLSAGVGILLVPVALWIVVPTVALLYEAMVIDLGPFAQSVVRFVYAVIEPPGMIYAIPVLLWAALLRVTNCHPIRFALVKESASRAS